jgi:diacylglycerol O-acyltransferase / wax synthase
MDRMSAQDASFLHLESDHSPRHVGGVSIFEGPAPPPGRFEAQVAAKLDLVPRYRQVVRTIPLGLGSPVWADDPHFNLGYHVRRTALPAPGSDAQLRALVGRVMSQNLDRDKPLWEMWLVEGLLDGRWALLSKVHHCMVDGIASTDLMSVLLDTEPDPARREAPSVWAAGPYPSEAELLVEALAGATRVPLELARGTARLAGDPRALLAGAGVAARGLIASVGLARRPPQSSLNGPLGPHRRWGWARGTLADVKRVRAAFGGTVNDVVLAAISQGFRELLLARGEPVDRTLRSLVPVSVRRPGERGTYNNRVSAMFADLPIDLADPVGRLHSVSAQMAGLKDSNQAVAGEVLTSLSGFAPPLLLMLGARTAGRLPQRNINTGTTNVPGPQFPLYAAGRRMLESFPYIPLFASVRLAVAIFSYDGKLSFGISGDYDTSADLSILGDGIEHGLAELVAAAARA